MTKNCKKIDSLLTMVIIEILWLRWQPLKYLVAICVFLYWTRNLHLYQDTSMLVVEHLQFAKHKEKIHSRCSHLI